MIFLESCVISHGGISLCVFLPPSCAFQHFSRDLPQAAKQRFILFLSECADNKELRSQFFPTTLYMKREKAHLERERNEPGSSCSISECCNNSTMATRVRLVVHYEGFLGHSWRNCHFQRTSNLSKPTLKLNITKSDLQLRCQKCKHTFNKIVI